MKRYVKHEAESDLGSGIAYLEFDGKSQLVKSRNTVIDGFAQ